MLFVMHIIDIFAYILDMLGFILKNLRLYLFKFFLDLPSFVIMLVVQFVFYRALFLDHEIEETIKSWIITEVIVLNVFYLAWSFLSCYIYCIIHSPQFQYKYYLSLRNYDNDEDEEFKRKYYN